MSTSSPKSTPKGEVTFTRAQLNELGLVLGGKTFNSADDIIKAFRDYFTLNVGGIATQLAPEDLQALKDQYASFTHYPFEEYVRLSIQEAMTQYLWGSTNGILV